MCQKPSDMHIPGKQDRQIARTIKESTDRKETMHKSNRTRKLFNYYAPCIHCICLK